MISVLAQNGFLPMTSSTLAKTFKKYHFQLRI